MVRAFVRRSPGEDVPRSAESLTVLDIFDSHSNSNVTHNVDKLVDWLNPAPIILDLITLGVAVYVCDKRVLRKKEDDGWTRSFSLSLPVSDVAAWQRAETDLVRTLTFLTGDDWQFEWREHSVEPVQSTSNRLVFDKVALFSGGLDSLIGAIDLLDADSGARVALLGHHDSTMTVSPQRRLLAGLQERYGAQRIVPLPISARPAPARVTQAFPFQGRAEESTRSRSFLFISVGIAAAAGVSRDTPLHVCENGLIALNVALTEARLGSCSTRTTHPHYFACFEDMLRALGVNNFITNPYGLSTKGEMIRSVRDSALLDNLGAQSISCAHPEVAHYLKATNPRRVAFGATYGNCGYCYPCIIRRAAFHSNGKDDPEHSGRYLFDVTRDFDVFMSAIRTRDARAVFTSFHDLTPPAISVLSAGPIPSGFALADLVGVYLRGREELSQLFADKSSADVRRIAGI